MSPTRNTQIIYNLFLCEYLSSEYGVSFAFKDYYSLKQAIEGQIISDLFFGHLYKNFFINHEPDKIRLLWADEKIAELKAEIASINEKLQQKEEKLNHCLQQ